MSEPILFVASGEPIVATDAHTGDEVLLQPYQAVETPKCGELPCDHIPHGNC